MIKIHQRLNSLISFIVSILLDSDNAAVPCVASVGTFAWSLKWSTLVISNIIRSISRKDLLAASLSVEFVIVITIVRISDVDFCTREVSIYVLGILALNKQVVRSKVWRWLSGYRVDDARGGGVSWKVLGRLVIVENLVTFMLNEFGTMLLHKH